MQVQSFRRRKAEEAGTSIRDWLARWADAYGDLLAEAEPETPASVVDRAADIWEPLLAIADLVGGEWPALARQAAVVIVGGRVAEDASVGVRLLADIQSVMSQDRMPSADLLGKLNGLEESGYGGWNDGKGINARDLARRLKPYGVEPKVVRQPDGSTPRGYLREQFHDAWSRYLRHVAQQAQQAQQDVNSNSGDVAGVAPVADRDGDMEAPQRPKRCPAGHLCSGWPQQMRLPVARVPSLVRLLRPESERRRSAGGQHQGCSRR